MGQCMPLDGPSRKLLRARKLCLICLASVGLGGLSSLLRSTMYLQAGSGSTFHVSAAQEESRLPYPVNGVGRAPPPLQVVQAQPPEALQFPVIQAANMQPQRLR